MTSQSFLILSVFALENVCSLLVLKVCGGEIPPEERKFVSLYPRPDPSLLTYQLMEAGRPEGRRRERTRTQYEYVEDTSGEEDQPTVLPKLTCDHCGKSFSRKSTLDQHIVTHSRNEDSETWEDVQDAAIDDLEQAIVYG